MIEPTFGLCQGHLVSRNLSQNVRAWTPGTRRIRKLLEQASAKRVEDAPFVSLGISLRVQTARPITNLLDDLNDDNRTSS